MAESSVLGQIALAYCPVIDRNRSVIATRLTVFPLNAGGHIDATALLAIISEAWPVGGPQLWLNVLSENLVHDLIEAKPATNILIEIPAFMACSAEHTQLIRQLHAKGNTLLLKGRPLHELPREILPCFKYSIIDYAEDRRAELDASAAPSNKEGITRTIGHVHSGISSIESMEQSLSKGSAAVLGWPLLGTTQTNKHTTDQPGMQVIVQLIDQVHKQADIEEIEGTLKRDPPLAYKLMRLINSPAFGLSVEISSFKHAIMILGYQRLKRWLALLLVTASKDPNMGPIMFAAVRRGLLLEEFARLGGNEEMRNELFICGVFSLLDRMFNKSFSELLNTIPVPERVYEALTEGTGPYAAYVKLSKAIEGQTLDEIKEGTQDLFMSFADTNKALLKALSTGSQID